MISLQSNLQESINIEWQALTPAIIDTLNTLNQFENNAT